MNANDMFPSKYLKADDIGDKQPVVVIEKIEVETMPDGNKKPSISFLKCKKKLMVNKTNWNTLIKLYGPDTSKWTGKPVTLKTMEVQFKDELVNSIRISGNKPAAAAPAAAAADLDAINADMDADANSKTEGEDPF